MRWVVVGSTALGASLAALLLVPTESVATATILGSWALVAYVLIGLGAGAARILGPRPLSVELLFISFWLGWCISVAFLQVWSLFFPVDQRAAGVLLFGGLAGSLTIARAVPRMLAGARVGRPFAGIAVFVFLLWAANHAMGPIRPFDAGLYHVPTIKWNNTYPVVPGLGNLHKRLAFNSSHFLYVAAANVGPLSGKGYALATSLLFVVFVIQGAVSLTIVAQRPTPSWPQVHHYVLALAVVPAILILQAYGFATTTSDGPLFLLDMVAAAYFTKFCTDRTLGPVEERFLVAVVALLAVGGVVAKLSGVLFFLPVVVMIAIVWMRRGLPLQEMVRRGCGSAHRPPARTVGHSRDIPEWVPSVPEHALWPACGLAHRCAGWDRRRRGNRSLGEGAGRDIPGED